MGLISLRVPSQQAPHHFPYNNHTLDIEIKKSNIGQISQFSWTKITRSLELWSGNVYIYIHVMCILNNICIYIHIIIYILHMYI